MRLPEQRLWDCLNRNMVGNAAYPALGMERIENVVGNGTPDLHCIARGRTSWVELKYVPSWPVRPYSPVLARASEGGLSQDQKNWHLAYRQRGGRVATLFRVGSYDWVLLDGQYSDTANEMSRPLLERVATVYVKGQPFYGMFYDWLTGTIG